MGAYLLFDKVRHGQIRSLSASKVHGGVRPGGVKYPGAAPTSSGVIQGYRPFHAGDLAKIKLEWKSEKLFRGLKYQLKTLELVINILKQHVAPLTVINSHSRYRPIVFSSSF